MRKCFVLALVMIILSFAVYVLAGIEVPGDLTFVSEYSGDIVDANAIDCNGITAGSDISINKAHSVAGQEGFLTFCSDSIGSSHPYIYGYEYGSYSRLVLSADDIYMPGGETCWIGANSSAIYIGNVVNPNSNYKLNIAGGSYITGDLYIKGEIYTGVSTIHIHHDVIEGVDWLSLDIIDVNEANSTDVVTNLNADLLDGQEGSYYAAASSYVPYSGATGTIDANQQSIKNIDSLSAVDFEANSIDIGSIRWDNGSGKIDGEQIADDTIDDDSLDFTDITLVDFTVDIASTALTDTADLLYEAELDSEAELEAQIADMANILQENEIDASAELLAIMDDETGTGALVFATSPTLVTPALGTISSGIGTALTALNGENIQDDTIDDDSLDFTDITLNDFNFDVGSVDKTEFSYLNGVTSAIQTQLSNILDGTTDFTKLDVDNITINGATITSDTDTIIIDDAIDATEGAIHDIGYVKITPSAGSSSYIGLGVDTDLLYLGNGTFRVNGSISVGATEVVGSDGVVNDAAIESTITRDSELELTVTAPLTYYKTTGSESVYGAMATARLDADTDEYAVYGFVVPANFKAGGDITVRFGWFPYTQTGTNTVCLYVNYNVIDGDGLMSASTSLDVQEIELANNEPVYTEYITTDTISGLAAGDIVGVRLYRDADDANDTAAGDTYVSMTASIEYTAKLNQ